MTNFRAGHVNCHLVPVGFRASDRGGTESARCDDDGEKTPRLLSTRNIRLLRVLGLGSFSSGGKIPIHDYLGIKNVITDKRDDRSKDHAVECGPLAPTHLLSLARRSTTRTFPVS